MSDATPQQDAQANKTPTTQQPKATQKQSDDKTSTNAYDLPRANVYRIVKNVLPEGVLLVNDAKIAFAKAAVVFIMYLTAASQEHAARNKRSTLMADDVLSALDDLELGQYREELLKTLEAYRKSQKAKKASKDTKPKTAKKDDETPTTDTPTNDKPPAAAV